MGDGSKSGTTQGPIINSKQLSRIERIVMESLSQGAVLELGGETLGNCYLPTILTGVKGAKMSVFDSRLSKIYPCAIISTKKVKDSKLLLLHRILTRFL